MENIIVTGNRIDAVATPELDKQLSEMIAQAETDIYVDMDSTTYICSVGLRTFMTATKKMRAKQKRLILKNVKPQVMEVFEVTGFSGILNFE